VCGLAGYVSARTFAPEVLERMTGCLAHRGPDADGHYRDGPVALGHRRLSIIDLAGSPQPMSTPEGDLTVVFNGEIYNFREVRETLAARGHRFRTSGDTEALLYAYREYGEAMLGHLRGMFAFALWDRPRGRLFIARDHLGVKPLYYHWDGATLAFGSELKALLAHPAVSRDIDLDSLGLFLECQYIPSPRSIYGSVRKLEAGHALRVEGGKLETWEYWRPDYTAKLELDEEEAVERLDAELRRSVEGMLVSDVPLGSFLSGGIDSSLVSALMVDLSGRPIDTFTLGFEGEQAVSEHRHAELVARHIGATSHVLMMSQQDLVDSFAHWVDAFDEPFADPAALPTLLLSRLTRRHVTVALTGEGADEVFSGYGNYRKRVQEERVTRFLGSPLSPLHHLVSLLPARVRKDRVLKAIGERKSRRYVTIPHVFDAELASATYADRFLEKQQTRMADFAERYFEECNSAEYIDRLMYVDARLWLPDDLLTKVDRATMAHSLEARVPYLDHRFFEFCARLDPQLKQRGTTGKYILKKLAGKYLPETTVQRSKQGFVPPLAEWYGGLLRQDVERALSPSGLGRRGLFQPQALERLRRAPRPNDVGRVWALLVLEKWFDRYSPDFSLG
jgi:asparagine synthase (glutamine-hydrolysing)